MNELDDVIRKSYPIAYGKPVYIQEEKYIKRLIRNINEMNLNEEIEFNTGRGDGNISKITYLCDNTILLDFRRIYLYGVWLWSTDNVYDNIILLDCKIKDYSEAEAISLVVSDKFDGVRTIQAMDCAAGYVEIDDEVYNINELDITDMYDNTEYKYIGIGTRYNNIIQEGCDVYLNSLQSKESLNENDIVNLRNNIKKIRHSKLLLYM